MDVIFVYFSVVLQDYLVHVQLLEIVKAIPHAKAKHTSLLERSLADDSGGQRRSMRQDLKAWFVPNTTIHTHSCALHLRWYLTETRVQLISAVSEAKEQAAVEPIHPTRSARWSLTFTRHWLEERRGTVGQWRQLIQDVHVKLTQHRRTWSTKTRSTTRSFCKLKLFRVRVYI